MTNRELQEELKKFPDNADMWININVRADTKNSVQWIRSLSILTQLTVEHKLNQLTLESKIE